MGILKDIHENIKLIETTFDSQQNMPQLVFIVNQILFYTHSFVFLCALYLITICFYSCTDTEEVMPIPKRNIGSVWNGKRAGCHNYKSENIFGNVSSPSLSIRSKILL